MRTPVVVVALVALAVGLWTCVAGEPPAERPPGDRASESGQSVPDRVAGARHRVQPEPLVETPSPAVAATPAVATGTGEDDGVLTGRVGRYEDAGDDGERFVPLPGVRVRLYVGVRGTTEPVVIPPTRVVVTGTDGTFRFPVGPDIRWLVVVDGPGRIEAAFDGTGPDDVGDFAPSESEFAHALVVGEDDVPLPLSTAFRFAGDGDDRIPIDLFRADAEGRIEVPTGEELGFTAPGHAIVCDTVRNDDQRVELPVGHDVAGVIVDERGTPYAATPVVATTTGAQRRAVTDEHGAFHVTRLAPTPLIDLAVQIGDAIVHRTIPYGETEARVMIPRNGDVQGIVVHADGTPAPDALVEGDAIADDGTFRVWTDGDPRGRTLVAVVTRVVAPGICVVAERGRASFDVPAGGTVRDLRIVLADVHYSFARVRAVDEDGAPVPVGGAYLRASQWGHALAADGATATVWAAQPPGTELRVQVSARTNDLMPGVVTVATGESPDGPATDVVLVPPAPVTVRAFGPDGDEIGRDEWTRFAVEGHGVHLRDDGRLDAPPSAYFRVVLEARGRRFDARVGLNADREVRLEFPRTSGVRGRLVFPDGGAPLNAYVGVYPLGRRGARTISTCAADDGTFELAEVPTGDARLSVWVDDAGVAAHSSRIEVPGSGELDLGDVPVLRPVTLRGRAAVPDDAGAAGLIVELAFATPFFEGRTVTDAAGRFELRTTGAHDVIVVVNRRGRLTGLVAIDLAQTSDVTVPVHRVGRLRVRLPAAWQGEPLDVVVELPGCRARWEPRQHALHQNGDVLVDDLPEGRLHLVLVHGGVETRATVTIRADEETLLAPTE